MDKLNFLNEVHESSDNSTKRHIINAEEASIRNAKSDESYSEPQKVGQCVGKVKKKRVHENTQVYGYMKKKVLNHLEENGCCSKSVDDVIAASKFNKATVLEYMNQRMQMAQINVHEECESLSFTNIESWLKVFKNWNLPELCLYEPALVINAIANNEDFPEPDQLEGVDLKSIYNFLGNALMGLPQPKLDAKSAEFLANEFEVLVGEANTENGDNETVRISNQLQSYVELPFCTQTGKSSIDPLCLGDNFKLNL